MQPIEISFETACNLFQNTDFVIYIRFGNNPIDLAFNTFMLNGNVKDASLNMYIPTTPREIGLTKIVEFIKERVNEPLSFFTNYSTQFLIPNLI